MTTTHAMLDIETLGVKPGYIVGCIGFVEFDPRDCVFGRTVDGYWIPLNYRQSANDGFKTDDGTLKFWENQNKDLFQQCFQTETERDNAFYLKLMNDAVQTFKAHGFDGTVWAKGPHFDISILESYYDFYGVEFPFKYNAPRDVRTAMDLGGVDYSDIDIKGDVHNPVDDCRVQVALVQKAHERIYGTCNEH